MTIYFHTKIGKKLNLATFQIKETRDIFGLSSSQHTLISGSSKFSPKKTYTVLLNKIQYLSRTMQHEKKEAIFGSTLSPSAQTSGKHNSSTQVNMQHFRLFMTFYLYTKYKKNMVIKFKNRGKV